MEPGIDHLVVAAADLERGRRQLETLLGVSMSPGGKHDRMGTHNFLLKLGPTCYLEMIAVDPAAPDPAHPRWFELDRPETAARLSRGACLLTWVVHGLTTKSLPPEIGHHLGERRPMRRGNLQWTITLPADGRLPASGMLPALIHWSTADHPAGDLPDQGCRLEYLLLQHPGAAEIVSRFNALGVTGLRAATGDDGTSGAMGSAAKVATLVARIRTPVGSRIVTSEPAL